MAGALVESDDDPVVAELEDALAVDHRGELEQGVVVALPQLPEGRPDPFGRREVAGVVLGVAEDGPGEPVGLGLDQRWGGLGDETGVGG